MDLTVGVSQKVILRDKIDRVQIANGDDQSSPATFKIVNEHELVLMGEKAGRTVLNIWIADAKTPGRQRIVSYLVRVLPEIQRQRDMESLLNEIFPNSRIEVKSADEKLVITVIPEQVRSQISARYPTPAQVPTSPAPEIRVPEVPRPNPAPAATRSSGMIVGPGLPAAYTR